MISSVLQQDSGKPSFQFLILGEESQGNPSARVGDAGK